jgi:hypothetical protein
MSIAPETFPVDPHAEDVDAVFACLVAELSEASRFEEGVRALSRIESARARLFAEEAIELVDLVQCALEEAGPSADTDLVIR